MSRPISSAKHSPAQKTDEADRPRVGETGPAAGAPATARPAALADTAESILPQGKRGRSARSRIAQAGQRLFAEAVRALARETPPRKRRPEPQTNAPPLPDPADGLSASERLCLVEVIDASGRPLLCMPPEAATRQGLRFGKAAVALRTRENKILLRKNKTDKPGAHSPWDLYTGFVRVGEASEDAAIRLLATEAALGGLKLDRIAVSDDSALSVRLALYVADLPPGLYPPHPFRDILEVDADELAGLARDIPDMLSKELVWALAEGLLYKK